MLGQLSSAQRVTDLACRSPLRHDSSSFAGRFSHPFLYHRLKKIYLFRGSKIVEFHQLLLAINSRVVRRFVWGFDMFLLTKAIPPVFLVWCVCGPRRILQERLIDSEGVVFLESFL